MPPTCPPKVQHGECQVNMIRKQQCSFSWDWGPAFAPIGINSPVILNILDEDQPFDFDFSVSVYPYGSIKGRMKWALDFLIRINQSVDFSSLGTVNVRIDEIGYNDKINISIDSQNSESRVKFVIVDVSRIKLWWPSGYGDQMLYNLSVSVSLPNSEQNQQKSKRIGFRSVELIEEPVDSNPDNGLTFYFSINKQPIFLKGSFILIGLCNFSLIYNIFSVKAQIGFQQIHFKKRSHLISSGGYLIQPFWQT